MSATRRRLRKPISTSCAKATAPDKCSSPTAVRFWFDLRRTPKIARLSSRSRMFPASAIVDREHAPLCRQRLAVGLRQERRADEAERIDAGDRHRGVGEAAELRDQEAG